jgi:hypothetical protein
MKQSELLAAQDLLLLVHADSRRLASSLVRSRQLL